MFHWVVEEAFFQEVMSEWNVTWEEASQLKMWVGVVWGGDSLQQEGAWPVIEMSARWQYEMGPEEYAKT